MAKYTWNGGEQSPWASKNNWLHNTSATGLPGSADDAIIDLKIGTPYTVIGNSTGTIASLTLGGISTPFAEPTLKLVGSTDLSVTNSLINDGTITLSKGQSLTVGSLANNNVISLDGGTLSGALNDAGVIQGYGTINGPITGRGTIDAQGGALTVNGSIASPGVAFQVGNSATLEVNGSVVPGSLFQFQGSAGVLAVDETFKGTISGLDVGTVANPPDTTVQVDGLLTSGTVVGSNLNLYNGASLVATETLANTFPIGTAANVLAADPATTLVFLTSDQPCYVEGTRILTPDGERNVEDLSEGDMVMVVTDQGQIPQPVTWIGHRTIDLSRHPRPDLAAPIRIRRNSIGPDQPHRDLLVSPDHCLFIDGMLIPALMLVNDMTIVQERDRAGVLYFHVELERHGILLAEGQPAESYLDTGNRAFFANAGLAVLLHPEFGINESLRAWKDDACAPLTVDPQTLQPIWQRYADRAEQMGFMPRRVMTDADPDLRIVIDGKTIRPVEQCAGHYTFVLPGGTGCLALVSRATQPAQIHRYLDDRRSLGVAVAGISLRLAEDLVVFPADHLPAGGGWHGVETAAGRHWRWTNGAGELRFDPLPEATVMEVRLGGSADYIIQELPARFAA